MDRLISEKQVIDTIKTWATPLQISNSETIEDLWVNGVCELIKAIPSAEPTVAQERYEDLCEYFGSTKDILNNREDFKAWLERIKWHIHKAEELYEKYEQEPKTGHWIEDEYEMEVRCSACGEENGECSKYCPNCGAKMD